MNENDSLPVLCVGGPLHGQRVCCDLPRMRCMLPDPHRMRFRPLTPAKPDCLEQREIEALTGRTYRRHDGPLLEDFERDSLRMRDYERRNFVIAHPIPEVFDVYVFCGMDDDTAAGHVLELFEACSANRRAGK